MIFLKGLFIVIEVLCCLMLIGLILLQRSKKEGLGLAFGAAAGETLFGSRAGNVLSKATVILGIVFMASTLILGVIFAQKDKPLIDRIESTPAQPVAVQPQPMEGIDLAMPTMEDTPAAEEVPVEPANETM